MYLSFMHVLKRSPLSIGYHEFTKWPAPRFPDSLTVTENGTDMIAVLNVQNPDQV